MARRRSPWPPRAAAALGLAALLVIPSPAALGRQPRSHAVVYPVARGKVHELWYHPLHGGRIVKLWRGAEAPTAVQCTADGRHVVFAAASQFLRVPTRGGQTHVVHAIPRTLWQGHRADLRGFVQLSPTGRYAAVPDPEGVLVHDLREGKPLTVRPPAAADGTAATVRVIHPVRWRPTQDAFLYLTQDGERGPGEVTARVFDLVQGRHTLAFAALPDPVDAVEAYDAAFGPDGVHLALSLRVRRDGKVSTRHRAFSLNPYQPLSLPPRMEVGRLHGFDPKLGDLIFTAKLSGGPAKLWSYSFTRARKSLLDLGFLGPFRQVLGFSPESRTALVGQVVPGQCGGLPRLFKASIQYPMKALVRWAVWTEIVATDPMAAWYVFRSGSTCQHGKPVLYLMQADGWGLMNDLPDTFSTLRRVAPADAALCPLQRKWD